MSAPVAPRTPASGLRARARWALALRLARRQARRHPWRHALVVLLIFVPVLATFVAFSGIETASTIDRMRIAGGTGGADAVIDLRQWDGNAVSRPRTTLAPPDPGVHVERRWRGVDWMVPSGSGTTRPLEPVATVAVPQGGRLERQFRVDRGHLPRHVDDVFLTAPAARAGGWRVGDHLSLATTDRRFTVVGIGVLRGDTAARVASLSDELPEAFWTRRTGGRLGSVVVNGTYVDPDQQEEQAVVWTPDVGDPFALEPLASSGAYTIEEPSFTADPVVGIGISVAGAGLAVVAAVVASAAFAIGARRQLRDVGLLATAGADPTVVRAALVLQGALPGAIAAIAAVSVAALAAAIANGQGVAERLTHVAGARIDLSTPGALVAVAIGIGAGVAAAWQPARSTSRLPLLSALGGRRPQPPVGARVPLAGLLVLAVGFSLLVASRRVVAHGPELAKLVPIAGVICFALGAVGLAPALVAALGPLSSRVTGMARLSLRGLVRHRSQSAATVAAMAVALALPIGLLSTNPHPRSVRVQDERGSRPLVPVLHDGALTITLGGEESSYAPVATQAEAIRHAYTEREAEVLHALDAPPVRIATRELRLASDTAFGSQMGGTARLAVVDDDDLERVLAPWAARQLAQGRVIVSSFGGPSTPVVAAGSRREVLTPATVPDGGQAWLPRLDADVVASASTAARLTGSRPLDLVTFVPTTTPGPAERRRLQALTASPSPRPPTVAQVRAALAASASDVAGQPLPADAVLVPGSAADRITVDVSTGDAPGPDRWTIALVALAGAATLLALVVLTITLSLRAVDGADDARAALAAGAPPAATRRVRAVEGVVLTTLGAALALPLGWLPVVAVRWGAGRNSWYPGTGGPGWLAVPVLLVPVLLAGLIWTVVPALRASVVDRRGRDVLLPRW